MSKLTSNTATGAVVIGIVVNLGVHSRQRSAIAAAQLVEREV
jgi:hypothetical protein